MSAAAAVAVLASAAPAQAQLLITFGGTPGKVLSEVDVPVSVSGQIVVSFHGDGTAGCASSGVCAYSGTVTVRPASGDIFVVRDRQGGVTRTTAELILGSADGVEATSTSAHVDRAPPGGGGGTCADVVQQSLGTGGLTIVGGEATLSVFARDSSLLATRCAGPLDGDVANAGPAATITLRALLRGRRHIGLARSATFAAHGFAGIVSSSIGLRLGAPQNLNTSSSSQFPPGIKTERIRIVTEPLAGVGGTGAVTAQIAGAGDPTECELLDSCGLSGSLTFTPDFRGVTGNVEAVGPANRPYRDFLAALGLGRGNTRGIRVLGGFGSYRTGTVASAESQAGSCDDTAPLGPGGVVLMSHGASLAARYSLLDSGRTRCPGPMISPDQTLASGMIRLSLLRQRRFTISMAGNQSFTDDGYTGRTGGRISLTLRRGRIIQHISTQPTGF